MALLDTNDTRSPLAQLTRVINWQPYCFKVGRKWNFEDVYGNWWQVFFKTKKAAREMGLQHKEAVMSRLSEEMKALRESV